jgi:predicted transcriptional regulator
MVIHERPTKKSCSICLTPALSAYLDQIAASCKTNRSGVVEDLIMYYMSTVGILDAETGERIKVKL